MRIIQLTIALIIISGCQFVSRGEQKRKSDQWIAGFAFSIGSSLKHGNMESYELNGVYLRDAAHYKNKFNMMMGFGATVGALRESELASFITNAKVQFEPSFFNKRLMLVLATGPALISRINFPNREFGGPLQFISSVGLSVRPLWRITVGYRFQHMSNANIYPENLGLNLQIIQLNYLF